MAKKAIAKRTGAKKTVAKKAAAKKRYTGGVKIGYGKKTPAEKEQLLADFRDYGFKSAAEFKAKLEAPSAPKVVKARKAAKAPKASGGKGRGRKKKSDALKAATYAGLTLEECKKAEELLTAAKAEAKTAAEAAKAEAAKKAEAEKAQRIKELKAELAKLEG